MLSDRKLFLVIGSALVVFVFLSFVALAIIKVATGHSLDVLYYSPRGQPVPIIAALIAALVLVVAVISAGVLRFIVWYRQRRTVTPNNRWRGP